MKIKLNANDAEEVRHKLGVLSDTPELQEDYSITQEQADELERLVPRGAGLFVIPKWAIPVVRGEMEDHVVVMRDMAADARGESIGHSLRISKQARRIEKMFA